AALAGISTNPSSSLAGPVVSAETVAHAIAARLPRTQVAKVDCAKVPGICEVQAGTNIFYVDPTARYLIVGRVYDMETRQDLT
ncbi:disulfide isomerase DsbC N-terminal domain-containing protein, partial [Acinetobacter baumannii]